MSGVVLRKEELETITRAARIARLAVTLEEVYDVIDEMFTSPERFRDSVVKLSRIIRKVYNDVERELKQLREAQSKQKEGAQAKDVEQILERARKLLTRWAKMYYEMEQILLSKTEKERKDIVKIFATLAIAPDGFSTKLAEIMKS